MRGITALFVLGLLAASIIPIDSVNAQVFECSAADKATCGPKEACIHLLEEHPDWLNDPFLRRYGAAFGGNCIAKINNIVSAQHCAGLKAPAAFCIYEWNGPISRQSVDQFAAFLKSDARPWGRKRFQLIISSTGGDVAAAIDLGQILRDAEAGVETVDTCASACVLVLAGAVSRNLHGNVIIHRPFRVKSGALGMEEAQRSYENRQEIIATYLTKMNIPLALLDAMLVVPSDESKVLSQRELEAFGLNQSDPVWAEERLAEAAAHRDMSIPEYLDTRSR